jgi:hypothetical protein
MNRYILIHRLTGPSILLLLGVVALLHEAHLVSWNLFVPLLLILIGLIKLAERVALTAAGDGAQFAGTYPGAPYPYSGVGSPQPPAQPGGAIIPAESQDPGKHSEGGQS